MNNNCLKCRGPYLNFKIDLHGYPHDRDRMCVNCDKEYSDILSIIIYDKIFSRLRFSYSTSASTTNISISYSKNKTVYGFDWFDGEHFSMMVPGGRDRYLPYFRPDLSDIPKLIDKLDKMMMLA